MGADGLRKPRLFDFGDRPLIVGRVPALPVCAAERLLHADDPLGEALRLYRSSEKVSCAVEVASPDLARALRAARGAGERALTRLLAVLLRMATRATPFGLHAGAGLVGAGDVTDLTMRKGAGRLSGRPDLGWLRKLVERTAAAPQFGEQLTVFPNGVMLARGGRLYFEAVRAADTGLSSVYGRGSVKATRAVEAAVDAARGGATAGSVASRIADRCGIPGERAVAHVDALLRAGVLVPRYLGNPVLDPAAATVEEIERIDPETGRSLSAVRAELANACARPRAEAFRAVIHRARALCPSPRSPIQVDSLVRFDGTLGAPVLDSVRDLGEIALAIAPRFDAGSAYARMFLHRFEGNEHLVPLLHFVGVIEDEELAASYAPSRSRTAQEIVSSRVLARVLSESLRDGVAECVLNDDDVAQLLPATDETELLPTFELAFHVAAADAGAIDRGEFVVVPARITGTPRAGASVARFGAADPAIANEIERFLRSAHDEDAVELAYLPAIGWHHNVAGRRASTERTIELGVGEPSPRALDLAQLSVTMRDERLVIWSHELRRFVRPVETTAYATEMFGSPLARFLRAVSFQGAAQILPLRWPEEELLPFTPRLRYRKSVLSLATWRPVLQAKTDAARWAEMETFRRRWNVPGDVVLVDGDNALPLDLDTAAGKMLFLSETRAHAAVTLQERFPSAADCWLRSEDGAHAAEFFVSCRARRGRFRALNGREAFAPLAAGVDADLRWVYVRWFAAPADADRLTVAAKALSAAVNEVAGVADWHVVRYRSPRFHLRVRVRCADPGAAQQVAIRFSRRLVADERIDEFELAEYQPERERYGGEAIAVVQRYFTHSSEAAARAFAAPLREERLVEALAALDATLTGGLDRPALDEVMGTLQLDRRSLTAAERRAVQRLRGYGGADREDAALTVSALRGLPGRTEGRSLLADIFGDLAHLHFNRFGLAGAAEQSAFYVLWHCFRARLRRAEAVSA
jgi:thiopeptide-type bacteriocin biosynthesis protein